MKEVIVIVGSIILGVLLVTTFILGDTGSFKSQGTVLGQKAVTDMATID